MSLTVDTRGVKNHEKICYVGSKKTNDLDYTETSMFGSEYKSNGCFAGCNRPHITGYKREFFAEVTMENNLIKGVK